MNCDPTPADVVSACLQRGLTVATGESLTAGLVAATLAEVPGCSAVLRGGVVAYQPDVKADLLGVPAEALAQGIVSEQVARALAEGAARVLRSDVGIGTTGVAGPDPHDGQPVGTVWIAVHVPGATRAVGLHLTGDREEIRRQTVVSCWALALELVAD